MKVGIVTSTSVDHATPAVFYAHEVATIRKIVEEHPGHDAHFYNAMLEGQKNGEYLSDVFGNQDGYFKHPLVEAAKYCHGICAVGDYTAKELRFLSHGFADTPVDEDPDGITNPSTGWAATVDRQRSNHVAYYYPWGFASNLDGQNIVCAPSGIACRTMTFNDSVAFLWFAPAGLRRGIITGISNLGYVTGSLGGPTSFVEINLNQGQRDALYQYAPSGDINPLVFFPGSGFVVWGQKTSAVAASATDRINVERLINYVKRQLRVNTLSFVFQPNDQLTRDNLKAVVDNFLGDLIVKRGLFDFATVCDESNNTPDRIDRNEMYIDVALQPVKAAEFIYIPIRIVTTGTEI